MFFFFFLNCHAVFSYENTLFRKFNSWDSIQDPWALEKLWTQKSCSICKVYCLAINVVYACMPLWPCPKSHTMTNITQSYLLKGILCILLQTRLIQSLWGLMTGFFVTKMKDIRKSGIHGLFIHLPMFYQRLQGMSTLLTMYCHVCEDRSVKIRSSLSWPKIDSNWKHIPVCTWTNTMDTHTRIQYYLSDQINWVP